MHPLGMRMSLALFSIVLASFCDGVTHASALIQIRRRNQGTRWPLMRVMHPAPSDADLLDITTFFVRPSKIDTMPRSHSRYTNSQDVARLGIGGPCDCMLGDKSVGKSSWPAPPAVDICGGSCINISPHTAAPTTSS
ncbi:hypothetical protein R3P38DRAFT_1796260 [Favolaschia claudopus]|uniref:Uncharacterized protein n=1 Tax=Favolaschia claudopus TaxID=2862362 RepID=A0AAW0A5Y4_9AGAR